MASDPLAPLLELADAVRAAKQVAADAKKKADDAKMAQIRVNEDLDVAKARMESVAKSEAVVAAREATLRTAQQTLADAQSKLTADARALTARESEIAKNETRLATALAEAAKLNDQAKSYEAQAYEMLQAKKRLLAEAESL